MWVAIVLIVLMVAGLCLLLLIGNVLYQILEAVQDWPIPYAPAPASPAPRRTGPARERVIKDHSSNG